MGQNGYLELSREVLATTKALINTIKSIEGIDIVTSPHTTAFAVKSVDPNVNILAVADFLEKTYGWLLERQHSPDCFHFSVLPHHSKVIDILAAALKNAVDVVRDERVNNNGDFAGDEGISSNNCSDDDILRQFNSIYAINQPSSILYNHEKN